MNKEIKTKWLKALRSGEYKQTTDTLFDGGGYCCLGVLCDLYRKETNEGSWEYDGDSFGNVNSHIFCVGNSVGNGALGYTVMEWAELSEINPIIKDNKSVAEFNDEGKTFEDMANLIEEYL